MRQKYDMKSIDCRNAAQQHLWPQLVVHTRARAPRAPVRAMRKGSKLSLRKQAAAAAEPLARSQPIVPPRSPLLSAGAVVNAGAPVADPSPAPECGLAAAAAAEEDEEKAAEAERRAEAAALVLPAAQSEDDYEEDDDDEGQQEDDDDEDDYAAGDDDDDDFDAPADAGGVQGLADRLAKRSGGAAARPQRSSSRTRRSSGVDLDAPVSADVPEVDLARRQRNIAMMEANAYGCPPPHYPCAQPAALPRQRATLITAMRLVGCAQ